MTLFALFRGPLPHRIESFSGTSLQNIKLIPVSLGSRTLNRKGEAGDTARALPHGRVPGALLRGLLRRLHASEPVEPGGTPLILNPGVVRVLGLSSSGYSRVRAPDIQK